MVRAQDAIGGLVSYATPRFLVARGVPLDRWIVKVAGFSTEDALWAATILMALVLFFADHILHACRSGKVGRPPGLVVWVVERIRNVFQKELQAETKPVPALEARHIPSDKPTPAPPQAPLMKLVGGAGGGILPVEEQSTDIVERVKELEDRHGEFEKGKVQIDKAVAKLDEYWPQFEEACKTPPELGSLRGGFEHFRSEIGRIHQVVCGVVPTPGWNETPPLYARIGDADTQENMPDEMKRGEYRRMFHQRQKLLKSAERAKDEIAREQADIERRLRLYGGGKNDQF